MKITARERLVRKLADDMHRKLCALVTDEGTESDVVEAFIALQAKPHEKCEVFWDLDNHYGWYSGDRSWHALLRRTRNNPTFGKLLFATFK